MNYTMDTSEPSVQGVLASRILPFLRKNGVRILRLVLYCLIAYIALFVNIAPCQGQGCSYYVWHGHCGPTIACNQNAYSAYSSFSDCHDVIDWAAYTYFCGGYGCSTGPIACGCAGPTHSLTVAGSVVCPNPGNGAWCLGGASLESHRQRQRRRPYDQHLRHH